MKESINLNTNQKVIEAFKLLKYTYPQAKLSYHSTNKYYWYFVSLSSDILYNRVVQELVKRNITFAVVSNTDNIKLEL